MGEIFRLTAKEAKTSRPCDLCDGQGLWLVVKSASNRKWVLRFTLKGKTTEMGLGSANVISLPLARERAQAARLMIANKVNPIEQRRAAKVRCRTFGEVAGELIAAKRSSWRSPIHARQWAALQAQCGTIWDRPVDTIGVVDILEVLNPLWTATPETASRVRGRIEAVLDFAKAKGWRAGENPAEWRGGLEHLLARRQKLEKPHYPAMAYRDIPAFVETLRSRRTVAALALEFLVLTACRSAEARAAQWSEIDFERATWTLPPGRMKAGLAHTVPLSGRAVEILREVEKEWRGSGLVFPGRDGRAPISSSALLSSVPEGTTLHGFRSSFRDWAGEATSFPREVAEHALAHATGNAVEQAYARSSPLERRRELMNAWAQFCEPEISANVIALARV